MAASKTIICNRALHFIGIGEEIASINERSPEAEACLLFYDDTLDELLREFPWPFARRRVSLALVSDEDTAYNSEFYFAYRYPSDALYIRRIASGSIPDTSETLIRYQISSDDSGLLLLTNEADVEIDYTARITDTQLFPVDFGMALSYRLAAYIAPRLAEDPSKAGQIAMRGYQFSIEKARNMAASEESEGPPPMSSFQRAR